MIARADIDTSSFVELCDSNDRARWLAMRRSGIGASEAAVLIGEHSRLTLARLVAEKRGKLPDEDAKEFLEWGLRHEPTMRAAYSEERYAGRITRPAGKLLRSVEHPWALATLDAALDQGVDDPAVIADAADALLGIKL